MDNYFKKMAVVFFAFLAFSSFCYAGVKGIYITQNSLENTPFISNVIKHAKAAGINTFVIDLERLSRRYDENIQLVKRHGLHYVVRVVMFHNGGTHEQVTNPTIWQQKYRLVEHAVALGADEIQLDYIRYNTKQKASADNAKNIHKIIHWYKQKLAAKNIPLQIDVFGVTSFGESPHIGQNLQLFAHSVDAICPMVYPSHYVPYPEHFRRPYDIVFKSLTKIKQQFNNKLPFKIYAYMELSNYHYPMNHQQKVAYIQAQLQAVKAAGVDGWYAWSPHNRYENLFYVLENKLAD